MGRGGAHILEFSRYLYNPAIHSSLSRRCKLSNIILLYLLQGRGCSGGFDSYKARSGGWPSQSGETAQLSRMRADFSF